MIRDKLDRPIRDLRVSVTDRCDFRCTYCMPLVKYEWLRREEILSFEEITRIVGQFARLGVEKVRLTGGEPLLRTGVEDLVRQIAGIDGIRDVALTTNASRLARLAAPLRDAGLTRLNVSLDTLDPEKFKRITQRDELDTVLEGIEAARAAGLGPIKINTVVERGVNEDDVLSMVDYCREHGHSLRFIEYMDVGNANEWRFDRVVPAREIVAKIRETYELEEIERERPSDTALRYRFAGDGSDLGIIASVSRPFCTNCSRARLTAEGKLVTCLFSNHGVDLKAPLREGATDDEMHERIAGIWQARTDRFSEERLAAIRSNRYDPSERRKIEMITLGG